jgi:hypothetical protein
VDPQRERRAAVRRDGDTEVRVPPLPLDVRELTPERLLDAAPEAGVLGDRAVLDRLDDLRPELPGDGAAERPGERVPLGHVGDEDLEIEATLDLYQWAVRAIHATAFADVAWGEVMWTVSPTEKLFGKEIQFGFALRVPLLDVPQEIAFPGAALERDPPLGGG